jgi:hypothetical protein
MSRRCVDAFGARFVVRGTVGEGGQMTVAELQKQWKRCGGDPGCQTALLTLFQQGGGTWVEGNGGKVFTDKYGGKVFIPGS